MVLLDNRLLLARDYHRNAGFMYDRGAHRAEQHPRTASVHDVESSTPTTTPAFVLRLAIWPSLPS